MNERVHLPCAACGAVNRVPRERLGQGVCGRCRRPLYRFEPMALDEAGFVRFRDRCDLPLLVDFWAAWCAPCRAMAPAFEQVARELGGRVVAVKVDTEQAAALAGRLGIRSIPTLALYREGREIGRVSGAMDTRALTGWVNATL